MARMLETRAMTLPRIFVSHSSEDAAFANRLSNDLRNHGADVWLDSSHMSSGDFIARINQALQQRDVVVLVLTPAAIRSNWVTQEFNAAIARSHQSFMRAPLVIMAQPCSLSDIPPLWTVYHRYDATHDYQNALTGLLQALGATGGAQYTSPPSSSIVAPPNAVPSVDSLRSNKNGWYTDQRVYFRSDGYHIQNAKNVSEAWLAWAPSAMFGDNLGNIVVSVTARIAQDATYHGAIVYFRAQDGFSSYGLAVTAIGKWCLFKMQGKGTFTYLVPWTEHQSIRQGLNASNMLKISAVGPHFDVFINEVKVGEYDDSTYLTGKVALGANYDSYVIFTDFAMTSW